MIFLITSKVIFYIDLYSNMNFLQMFLADGLLHDSFKEKSTDPAVQKRASKSDAEHAFDKFSINNTFGGKKQKARQS